MVRTVSQTGPESHSNVLISVLVDHISLEQIPKELNSSHGHCDPQYKYNSLHKKYKQENTDSHKISRITKETLVLLWSHCRSLQLAAMPSHHNLIFVLWNCKPK